MSSNNEEKIPPLPPEPQNSDKISKGKGEPRQLTKNTMVKMIWCLSLAFFFVVFIWGLWERDVYALGMNAFVFCLLTLLLYIWVLIHKKNYQRKDLAWVIPLALIPFSYLLYDNPFIKAVNFLIYPGLIVLFVNYGFIRDKEGRHWGVHFILEIIGRALSLLGKIGKAFNLYMDMLTPRHKRGKGTVRKIILGVVLFLIIALTFVIPLLSSADTVFAQKIEVIYDWIKEVVSITFINKTIVFIILSLLLFSSILAWGKGYQYGEKEESKKRIDPIVSGIVLGGILGLYLLFLWIQIERLWVGVLPIDFSVTENLVKSGFWQLFFLSVINTLIYFFTYRKTNILVQRILIAFTSASLFLLISAGHRMGLYVTIYGFSYEKFFASYTVLFSAILFIWLITRLFIKKRANVFKFLVFLFLWMFSIISIMPIEQFILRTNVALSKHENSRIRLFELTMLSPDVLSLVKKYKGEGVLKEKMDYLEREKEEKTEEDFDWGPWIEDQEKRIADKKWYEKNIINFFK